MKLLFDQNLSPKLVKELENLFPNSKHLQDLSLEKANDIEVWKYAKDNDFIIVSKDTDFIYFHSVKGFPPKLIYLKIGNCSTRDILQIILDHSETIGHFYNDTTHGLLILQ